MMNYRFVEYRAPNSTVWMRLPVISAFCAYRFFLIGNWKYMRDNFVATYVKDAPGQISKVS